MKRIWRLLGNRHAADVLLWVVITAPVLLSDEVPYGSRLSLPAVRLVDVVVLALAVVVARRLPLLAAVLPASVAVAVSSDLYSQQLLLGQLAFAFLLGRRTGGWQAVWQLGAGMATVGVTFAVANPGRSDAEEWFNLASGLVLQFVLPWTAGQCARQYAELIRAGWDLAERLEREHELVAHQVRLRERTRIAADMHDSLGHELSLIAVRAAALQVDPGIGASGQQAADELRQAAASATERLRQIIGMLREDGDDPPIAPAGDTIELLVRRVAESGVTVTLADSSRAPMPEVTARAAYRVVQEALTNATKHAPAADITVTLRDETQNEQVLVVDVVNGTPPKTPLRNDGAPGYGLIGLDERVRLVGGTLDVCARNGGFAVTARLPLEPVPAPVPAAAPTSSRALAVARRRLWRGLVGSVVAPGAMIAILIMLYLANFDRG
ncbi:MAG TPA: histidine kinase [Propionibacteriaceae bacterium]|nr:histidine kinase [Propionibacteriaceae bacterium]